MNQNRDHGDKRVGVALTSEGVCSIQTRSNLRNRGSDSGKYIPSLDGWRAIAILWVIISHNQLWQVGRFNDIWLKNTGDRGVQLFFALSGILICSRLLQEDRRLGSISLRSFYIRRVFRIQPAALLYLAIVALLISLRILSDSWKGPLGAALMIRNYWPAAIGEGYWYSGHYWSLAVEEHFYLFLPGFLLLCRRRRLPIMVALVACAEFWRIIVMRTPHLQHIGADLFQRTDTTIGGIFLGSVFAIALEHQRLLRFAEMYLRPWLALLYAAAVFIALVLHHTTYYHVGLITVYPVVITATMLHPASLSTRFLELAPVRFVGRISYSLYLWQQMFFNDLHRAASHSILNYPLLCWLGAFACAIASYYLIETPFIRIGHRLAKRAAPGHTLSVANVAGGVST